MKSSDKKIKLRTVFMGTSPFANVILEGLIRADYNLVAVYTRPDKKVGRNQELKQTLVKITAEKFELPVFSPDKFEKETLDQLAEQKPDLIVVVAYGKILPRAVLSLPGFGAINVHASLLPSYRGPSPIQNALLDGKIETGVTIMLMDEGIDTGAILAQKAVPIDQNEIYPQLSEKMSLAAEKLLLDTIPQWIKRKIEPIEQSGENATYCQLIERSDGKIIWEDDGKEIYNRYRAFNPWPGVHAYWQSQNSNLRIKLNKLEFFGGDIPAKHRPGEVFQLEEFIAVYAGDDTAIILQEIQQEGRNNLKIRDFLNGNPSFLGSVLK